PGLVIGSPMLGDELLNETRVQVALSMMNRHGLIAGATGTGKTKTLQLLAGELSRASVPVFVADIKGDVTGIAAPGDGTNPKVVERAQSLAWTFEPSGHPVEFLSLSGALGAQVRATVHSFGPLLLGKVLDLNETQPEVGDLPKPKLCFFFDEAHLLFDGASDALLEQIERTARLIRSKGVGVYFVTQAPTDVPSSVLAQLGNRVQHALRAFTPDDADALRKTARTFPATTHYDVEKTITSLGIGEALVTVLSPYGIPTP